jgi:hypothetical protein
MLSSLQQKVSSLVRHHREKLGNEIPIVNDVIDAISPSKNWDYDIVFKGAKVRNLPL